MENYSDDFISLLSEKDLLSGIFPTSPSTDDQALGLSTTTDETTNTHFLAGHPPDHKYCRSPLPSDSGFSSSDGPLSPPYSEHPSVANSPFSDNSGASPNRSDSENVLTGSPAEQIKMDSPLGGAVEDVQISDFNFETLDTSNLLQDEDLLKSLAADNNVSINLGKLCQLQTGALTFIK